VTEDERLAALKTQKGGAAKKKGKVDLAQIPEALAPERRKGEPDRNFLYVINLMSSLDPNIRPKQLLPDSLSEYRLYTTKSRKAGKVWYRLRLGFFARKAEAEKVRKLLKESYPRAWIDLVSREEREASVGTALEPRGSKFALEKPTVEGEILGDVDAQAEPLMLKGRNAVTRGDNVKAIQAFTKVLNLPKNAYAQDAQELLGLARERNRQLNLAKVEYKLYLKLYPTGEGADRVRQRLLNLTAGEAKPPVVLRAPAQKQNGEFQVFGTLSQNYFRGNSKVETTDTGAAAIPQATLSEVDQDVLLTTLDITGRYRSNRYDNRVVFSGDGTNDFLEDENTGRVSSAYIDIRRKATHEFAARLGRQSGNAYGVSGRFDGALLGYNLLPKAPESDKHFYGLSTDLGPFGRSWTGNLYFIQDNVDGITDRRAIGAELRYFSPKGSFFSLVDYDIYFDQLNIAFLQGNWRAANSITLNFLADYRNVPPLHTTTALQGQTVQSIHELLTNFSEAEVRRLALGLTATSGLISVGATGPINSKMQWNTDITVTNISGTEGGNGIPPTEGTGNITSYSAQLIGTNLLVKNDVTVAGLSYIDARDFDAASLSLVNRVPFKRRWRLEVSLKLFHQDNAIGTTLTRFIPAIMLDYRSKKNVTFELAFGRERAKVDGATEDQETVRDFISLGYRWDF
jgi:tetratricopeptide (TPR) repeat protein